MVSAENRTGLYIVIPLYFISLCVVAVLAWRQNQILKHRSDDLTAHYLGGRALGPLMTAGTMFASLFSGYTVVGIPNEAFKTGWDSLRWLPSGIGLLAGYAGTAYRLRRCSLIRNHQSPGDFITDRFRSQVLRYTMLALQAIPSIVYLAAQVLATKQTFNSIFEIDPNSPIAVTIIFVLILVFEWTGGLLSVAATDAIQGIIMVAAFLILPVLIHVNYGGWSDLNPETFSKPSFYQTPTLKTQWLMWNFSMVNIGFFSLPHLVQRTYAAKDLKSLKFGLACLAIGTWLTWIPGIYLGTMGVHILAKKGIENPASPFVAILEEIMNLGSFEKFVGVLAFTASLAAIMSTADSIISATSQLLTAEFAYPIIPDASPSTITWIGRVVAVILVIIALIIGLVWDESLTDLGKVQFGISLQCIPSFIVGLFAWKATDCHPWSLAAGGLLGFILTLVLYFSYSKVNPSAFPMDTGVTGLFFNCILVFLLETIRRIVTGTLLYSSSKSSKGDEEVLVESIQSAFILPEPIKVDTDEIEETIPFSNRPAWDIPKTSRFGEVSLTPALTWKCMEGTWEPLTNPALVFLIFVLSTMSIPWVPGSEPALNQNGTFDFPPSVVGGVPAWAFKMMFTVAIGTVVLLIMIYFMPNQYAIVSLDPNTVALLPDEMDKRKSYDETNVHVNLRRASIRDSIDIIKAKEARTLDRERRLRISQLILGISVEEEKDDVAEVEDPKEQPTHVQTSEPN